MTLDGVANSGPQGHVSARGLRVGVLLASDIVPMWQRNVIEELAAVDGVDLCVVGVHEPAARVRRVRDGGVMWRSYQRLATRRSSAMKPADIFELLRAVPKVRMSLRSTTGPSENPDRPEEALLSHRPDVILDLGAESSVAVDLARDVQTWRMQHGLDHDGADIGCIRELVEDIPLTQVLLTRLTPTPGGETRSTPLAAASFQTVPHNLRRNIDQAYLGSVELPAMAFRRILAGAEQKPRPPASELHTVNRRPPGGPPIVQFLARLTTAWLQRQMNGLTRADRWHVGLVRRPIESLLADPSIVDVEWFARPEGAERYVADPFGFANGDSMVVLVEDFDHRDRHGRIGLYQIPDSRQPPRGMAPSTPNQTKEPIQVLSLPTHASYPYTVEVDGSLWCVPETSAANEVRAFEFDLAALTLHDLGPLLVDVSLVDPTLFEWGGMWWLFGTDRSRGANTHLRAWWADHPKGPWTQHAIDPLCIDVRWARGAGTPFVHNGALYRPAQDCSHSYGGSVVIRRVLALDPNNFVEETAAEVRPDPLGRYPNGLHTISRVGDSFLLDGSRHRFSVAAFLHELRVRFGRAMHR